MQKRALFSIILLVMLIVSIGFAGAQTYDNEERNVFEIFWDWLASKLGLPLLSPRGTSDSPLNSYRVFVTSSNYSANELANADTICQQVAQQAGLTGKYVAWLSTSIKDAKDKISDGHYVRVDGQTVASNKADLLDGSLINPINVEEHGIQLPASTCDAPTCDLTYTGTNPDGTKKNGFMCNDWTSLAGNAEVGYMHAVDAWWTSANNVLCNSKQRIYCFEVPQAVPVPVGAGTKANLTTHLACLNNTCTLVNGNGSNQCSPQGSSCGQPNVIEVCTPQDLDNVRNNLLGNYLQTCDIDLAGYNFEPIGDDINPFNGTYRGNNHKISNLVLADGNGVFVGLFGVLGKALIEGVKLENFSITGHAFVGALSGANGRGGLIIKSGVKSSEIRGKGIVGEEISYNLGGLVGGNDGEIRDSYVIDSTIMGEAREGNLNVGGLVGENSGLINRSFAFSNVNGSYYVGGLVGRNNAGYGGINSEISNSYSRGSVIGNASAVGFGITCGGLVGLKHGGFGSEVAIIRNSFSATVVISYLGSCGGLIGFDFGGLPTQVTNSYWDKYISGQEFSAGGIGLATKAMKENASYQNWDFANTWSILEKKTYPWLPITGPDLTLLVHYPFDIVVNSPIQGIGYLTPDDSQYGRHGTVNGAYIVNSILGPVAQFTGDDSIYVGEMQDLIENEFTISTWIKLDKNTNETGQPVQTILSDAGFGQQPSMMMFVNQNNKLTIKFHYANNATAFVSVVSSTTLQKGKWYSITAGLEGTPGDKKLILEIRDQNGVLLENKSILTYGKVPYESGVGFTIGANNNAWYWNGAMNDLKIYNVA